MNARFNFYFSLALYTEGQIFWACMFNDLYHVGEASQYPRFSLFPAACLLLNFVLSVVKKTYGSFRRRGLDERLYIYIQ